MTSSNPRVTESIPPDSLERILPRSTSRTRAPPHPTPWARAPSHLALFGGVGSATPGPRGAGLTTSDPPGKGSISSNPRGAGSIPPNPLGRILPHPTWGLRTWPRVRARAPVRAHTAPNRYKCEIWAWDHAPNTREEADMSRHDQWP
jgi:hypothetical protein